MNLTITADDIKVGDVLVLDFDAYGGTQGMVECVVAKREDVFSGEGPYVWMALEAPDFAEELIVFDTELIAVKA